VALETVLIAVGDEEEAGGKTLARIAAETAAGSDATVVVGYSFGDEEYESAMDRHGFDRSVDRIDPADVASRVASVRAARDYLDDAGVDWTVRASVDDGGPEAFVRMSEDLDADRVVVGGNRRSPAGKAVFGSDAQSILLNAPCPVVYVRHDVA